MGGNGELVSALSAIALLVLLRQCVLLIPYADQVSPSAIGIITVMIATSKIAVTFDLGYWLRPRLRGLLRAVMMMIISIAFPYVETDRPDSGLLLQ
jgi:hypothetical protein